MSGEIKLYNNYIQHFNSYKKDLGNYFVQSIFDAENYLKNFKCSSLQFAYVINYRTGKITYHQNIEKVLGRQNEDIDMTFLFNIIHPDDVKQVVELAKVVFEFSLQCKLLKPFDDLFYIDYRVKKSDGTYIRVNRQSTPIEFDDDGNIVSAISICTDISNLKKSTTIDYGITGVNSVQFEKTHKTLNIDSVLSKREKEVLSYIIKGKTSVDIGKELNISEDSVKTYRKRILEKTECKNSAELIYYAVKKGIIDID